MARTATRIVIVTALTCGACSPPAGREYELRGQVLAVDHVRQEVTIKHEDIPRFMPGMTMAFRVSDKTLLQDRIPGDLVTATLVVRDTDVHLRTLRRTGFSPVTAAAGPLPMVVLARGEPVADGAFLDESGAKRRLMDWRGKFLVVTFIYTRCPLPDYCPVMDRHFRIVQDRIRSDAALAGAVQLLSVSIDPRHDTPAVLSQHAAKLQADPSIWQFLTGDADQVERFAHQFGVSISRSAETDPEIVHNLRTAVVDGHGRLVTVMNGSQWSPSELMTELRNARADHREP